MERPPEQQRARRGQLFIPFMIIVYSFQGFPAGSRIVLSQNVINDQIPFPCGCSCVRLYVRSHIFLRLKLRSATPCPSTLNKLNSNLESPGSRNCWCVSLQVFISLVSFILRRHRLLPLCNFKLFYFSLNARSLHVFFPCCASLAFDGQAAICSCRDPANAGPCHFFSKFT